MCVYSSKMSVFKGIIGAYYICHGVDVTSSATFGVNGVGLCIYRYLRYYSRYIQTTDALFLFIIYCFQLRTYVFSWRTTPWPGGGGALRYRGGPHPRYVFRRRRGLFLRPLHVRDFVKEGYFFCTQVRSMGVKIPLQSTKYTQLWRRVTPEVTGLPSLLPPLAAAKHAEDYKI